MRFSMKTKLLAGVAALLCPMGAAVAQDASVSLDGGEVVVRDVVVVTGQRATYAEAVATQDMIERIAPIGSVNQVLNELPGVHVTEVDFYGSADWATSISLRGFNSGPAGQQIGTTIDGLPNSGSNYGGGSRANRYIDLLALERVEVSQGTADISSRTNESLGGTLNFITADPIEDERVRMIAGFGDQSATKFGLRYDTGEILPNTYAYVILSTAENNDFVDDFSPIERDYLNAKVISSFAGFDLTGFLSITHANESEAEPVSLAQFEANPRRDALTSVWTGEPRFDEFYRSAWRAIRDNTFAWVGAERDFGAVEFETKAYFHNQIGRGDWVPPYLLDMVADGTGPNRELGSGLQIAGGRELGRIYYVMPNGATAERLPGCTQNNNPGCYDPTALPVMSYRHTHYKLHRYGLTADASWTANFGAIENTLRGGIWLETQDATTIRDWHRVLNASTGPAFDHVPYWTQYRRDFGADEFMYYLEDTATLGAFTLRAGLKQFFIDRDYVETVGRHTREGGAVPQTTLSSESDPLLHLGFAYEAPIDGLEFFAGYSQNYSAIPQDRMATPQAQLAVLEPETADSIEAGLRYASNAINLSATLFDISFENRTVFVAQNAVSGIDYLSQNQGRFVNLGGVQSQGVELYGAYQLGDGYSVSGAYTYNDATYVSTGFATLDAAARIKPGAQLFGAPKHMVSLSLDYAASNWNWGVNAKHVGERPVNFTNTQIADGYWVANAQASFSAGMISENLENLEFQVNVANLLDAEYVSGITSGAVYPAPGRTVFFTISADF